MDPRLNRGYFVARRLRLPPLHMILLSDGAAHLESPDTMAGPVYGHQSCHNICSGCVTSCLPRPSARTRERVPLQLH